VGALCLVTIGSANAEIDSPTVTPTESPTPAIVTPTPTPEPVKTVEPVKPVAASKPKPGGLTYHWTDSGGFQVEWAGECGSVSLRVGAENWGHLAKPRNGVDGVGGTASTVIQCHSWETSAWGRVEIDGRELRCWGFSSVWVEVSNASSGNGLTVVPIPAGLQSCNPLAVDPVPVVSPTPMPH
jgi:hypothetical protein